MKRIFLSILCLVGSGLIYGLATFTWSPMAGNFDAAMLASTMGATFFGAPLMMLLIGD